MVELEVVVEEVEEVEEERGGEAHSEDLVG